MARAQGARVQMALAIETVYGTAPASGYTRVPFASTSLDSEQLLLTSKLLCYGRDLTAPIKDAVTAVVVPIGQPAPNRVGAFRAFSLSLLGPGI